MRMKLRARNKKTSKVKQRERKTVLVVATLGLLIALGGPMASEIKTMPQNLAVGIETVMGTIEAQAAEQRAMNQSDRWADFGNGTWKLMNATKDGFVSNCWFQDLDGSWYMIDSQGVMLSGLVTDQSTGKTYLMNTNHDGTYGRMLHVNGTYNVNGRQVYLTFEQSHNGQFGAITSGLSELRGTGVKETTLQSIPTDSANTNSSGNNQTQQNNNQNQGKQPSGNTNGSSGQNNNNNQQIPEETQPQENTTTNNTQSQERDYAQEEAERQQRLLDSLGSNGGERGHLY